MVALVTADLNNNYLFNNYDSLVILGKVRKIWWRSDAALKDYWQEYGG